MSVIYEKLGQATRLVAEADVDVWLTFVRETSGHADPCLPFLTDSALTWESALMVARDGRRIAVVGNYDADPLVASRNWDQVVPYVQSIQDPLQAALEMLVPRTGRPPRIAVNWSEDNDKADGLTHGMFRRLEAILDGTRFAGSLVSAGNILGRLRGRKTPTEIERIGQAIAETNRLFDDVGNGIARIGSTEQQIWSAIQRRIDQRGLGYAWERSGNPIVNCGPASMSGHGTPSATLELESGHILHIDLGVVAEGYSSDLQRCWYVGENPPDSVRRAFDAVMGAIDAAAGALAPGVEGWTVDAAARKSIKDAGYPEYLHAVGHQVGRMAHDGGGLLGPRWERYGDSPREIVEADQVYTLELGVQVEGHGYLGIEEMVRVVPGGCVFLSQRQDELWLLG